MAIYGYARVSTRNQLYGSSIEQQENELRDAGAVEIYKDAFTGTKEHRPEFDKLIAKLKEGDCIMVTKLDRLARSFLQGSKIISDLITFIEQKTGRKPIILPVIIDIKK